MCPAGNIRTVASIKKQMTKQQVQAQPVTRVRRSSLTLLRSVGWEERLTIVTMRKTHKINTQFFKFDLKISRKINPERRRWQIQSSAGSFVKPFGLDSAHFYVIFYGSVVYRWWKSSQILKSVRRFAIIPFLCLGGWSRVDISAGLNLSQSLFCWFLGACWGEGEVWKSWWGLQSPNPQSEMDRQSGISLLWRIGLMFLIMSLNPRPLLSA